MSQNIAFLVGVSEYSLLEPLPACKNDVFNMRDLIATRKIYQNPEEQIICLSGKLNAVEIKDSLREFVSNHKSSPVTEVLFYFSGHGGFEDEVILCGSDFSEKLINTTSVSMSEIDALLRTLGAELTVKIIDSCSSGQRYIKDKDSSEIEKSLRKNFAEFNNVIFMFSSQENQYSFADEHMSAFTSSFIESIKSYTNQNKASIYYNDINSFIGDFFKDNNKQKPRFVTQSSGTEKFIDVSEDLKSLIENLSNGVIKLVAISNESVLEMVKGLDYLYCDEDEIKTSISQITKNLADLEIHSPLIKDLYEINIQVEDNLRTMPAKEGIAKWAYEQGWHKKYFVKIHFREIKNAYSQFETAFMKSLRPLFGNQVPTEAYDIEITRNLPLHQIFVSYEPKFKSIKKFGFYSCLVHSDREVVLLTSTLVFRQGISWETPTIDTSSIHWIEDSILWRELLSNPTILHEGILIKTEELIENYLLELTSSDETKFLVEKASALKQNLLESRTNKTLN